MLACELRLAGAHPVVLERRSAPSELPKANGLGGRIVRLLEYRGLLERFAKESGYCGPVPSWQFGPIKLDFTGLDDPMQVMLIQQPKLEALLAERAAELGVEIRRGCEVTGLSQDEDGVRVETGGEVLHARYLVGCDGGRSLVREQVGIAFPGTTESEVLRMGHFRVSEAPAQSDWVRTARGAAIVTSLQAGVAVIGVREETSVDLDTPLTLDELGAAYLRVTGEELVCGEPIWLSRTVSQARLASRYRSGRVFLAGDAAHLFPAGGSALNVGLLDTVNLGWKLAAAVRGQAPSWLLDSYHDERHPVGARTLMQTRVQAVLNAATDEDGVAVRDLMGQLLTLQEPVRHVADLLNSAEDSRFLPMVAASGRAGRAVLVGPTAPDEVAPCVDVVTTARDDSVLIRPDGHVAWEGSPSDVGEALEHWFPVGE